MHLLSIHFFEPPDEMKNANSAMLTVLTISMSLLILHFVGRWDWPVIASLIIGVAGVVSPKLALKVEYLWKALTKLLGLMVQRIVLILIFYLFLFPMALVARLISKRDPLQLSNNSSSTFVDINKSFDKKGFENPW